MSMVVGALPIRGRIILPRRSIHKYKDVKILRSSNMSRKNVASTIKRIIADTFFIDEEFLDNDKRLWNDFDADDLDLVDVALAIEDQYMEHDVCLQDILLDHDNTIGEIIQKIEDIVIHRKGITMKKIWVTFRRKGLHLYPQAANDPNLADVSYLGSEHRHLFWFKVTIEVYHDDREIEFHQFLNWLESLYDNNTLTLNHKSCEMLCDDLAAHIIKKYPNRQLCIDISEDGECGAECEYSGYSENSQ